MDILNVEVREEFIEMFSEDVLYNWAIECLENAGFTFSEILGIFEELGRSNVEYIKSRRC